MSTSSAAAKVHLEGEETTSYSKNMRGETSDLIRLTVRGSERVAGSAVCLGVASWWPGGAHGLKHLKRSKVRVRMAAACPVASRDQMQPRGMGAGGWSGEGKDHWSKGGWHGEGKYHCMAAGTHCNTKLSGTAAAGGVTRMAGWGHGKKIGDILKVHLTDT